MTRRLVSEAQKSSPRFGAVALQYVIVRGSGSGLAEYSASEESLINPGDTIKVMMITDVDAPSAEQVKAELLGAVERRAAKASPRGG